MLSPALVAAGVVFLAELGDKSQLMALAMAAKHRARDVFIGMFFAILLMFAIAVGLGAILGTVLDEYSDVVAIVAGLIFLGFAVWTLRDADDDEEAVDTLSPTAGSRTVITASFSAFVVAELGDKTQLASATLAVRDGFWPVYIGSVVGEVAAIGLAIMIGAVAGRHLPERLIRYGAAALFAVFGLIMIIQGLRGV
ncbi:TMEM165/GDT1 family protein [Nostocoides sp. F2B08]|uniref:TMEM165/GDT1 family protein n=1 Tax=Nostocoides sp. F2B08 TaxID=2653936 RepID=UPI001D03BAC5|nr:TMEM165/GDT1 family protein [Tetrasphaera sp. F2B08]